MSISIIAPYEITLASGLEFYPSAGSALATRLIGGNYQTTILAESGLITYLKMDGNFDDSKSTNHGTGYGGVLANGAAKYGTYSGNFDGVNDYVSLANESNFDFERTNSFSLEAWIKTTQTSSGYIIAKGYSPGADQGFYLGINHPGGGGKVYFYAHGGSTAAGAYGDTIINDDAWHHIVATYNGSSQAVGIKFYVDGVLQTNTITADNLSTSMLSNTPVLIGDRSGTNHQYFSGLIDEVAIYNRVLSASESLFHYQQQGYPTNSPAATHKFSIPGASIADIIDCLNYLENSFGGTGSLSYGYQLNGGSLVSGQTLAQLKAAVRNATITVHTDSLIVYVSHVSNGIQQVESSIKMGGGLHVVDPVGGGSYLLDGGLIR